MNKILEIISIPHNWLTDKDFIWWPFSFLKPKPNELMTLKLTMTMTACFGGLSYLMLFFFYWANNMLSVESEINKFFMCFIGFGLWFNLITKPLWNARAKKLITK